MNKIIIFGTAAFLLAGCGGSSSDDTPNIIPDAEESPADPIPDPTPEPEEETPEPEEDPEPEEEAPEPEEDPGATPTTGEALFPPDFSVTTCEGLDFINLIDAQSAANSANGFGAANAIDNDLSPTGRWESTDATAILTIDLGYRHEIKEVATAWLLGDEAITTFDVEASEDGIEYTSLLSSQASSGDTALFERFDLTDTPARFVRITSFGNDIDNTTALLEAAVFGCPLDVAIAPIEEQTVDLAQFGLDSSLPPGSNFDLLTWAIDTPEQSPIDGRALRISETDLADGYESDEFFFTADDGGMVFRSTIFGETTSENTSFTRSELRAMLRRGNTNISTTGVNENNFVLGYQPATPRQVGGRGGKMTATLKVDNVTVSGSNTHTGRFIIGQIHAEDDEPIRLYFKKFPENDRGYIYYAHEIRGGDDIWRVVVGEEHPIEDEDTQPIFNANPEQGIQLGEIFSYEIDQTDARIDVIVRRGDLSGPIIGHSTIDMEELNSGYDIAEEWMYFKAGSYSQNNTGDRDEDNDGLNSEFDQTTFYSLDISHEVNTQIVENTPGGDTPGNQFANITDTTGGDDGDTGELRYQLPTALAQGRLDVTFARTPDEAGNTDGFISLYNSESRNDNSILDLRIEDELFETRFPSVNIDTDDAEVTPGEFQTASITWEYPNDDTSSGQLPTVTIVIDGVQVLDPFEPTGSDPEGGVSNISFRFGNNSGIFGSNASLSIDNVRIYSDTQGNTLVFEDDFESYTDGQVLSAPYASATNEAVVATEQ